MNQPEQPRRLVVTLDGETLFEQDRVNEVFSESNIDGQIRIRATFTPKERTDKPLPVITGEALQAAIDRGDLKSATDAGLAAGAEWAAKLDAGFARGVPKLPNMAGPKRPWWKFWAR